MDIGGVIGIKFNGRYKVIYNRYGSHHRDLRIEMIDFYRKVQEDSENVKNGSSKKRHNMGWELFKTNCRQIKLVKDDNILRKIQETQGIGILETIYNGKLKRMINCLEFIKGRFNCEYAYIINLDEMLLQFYYYFSR